MNWKDGSHTSPCAKCPYRKDAPRAFWHPTEFRKVLKADAEPLTGGIFCCHNDLKRPEGERRPCVGWLLDQKRRDLPSIQLRIAFVANPDAWPFFQRTTDAGLELFGSIQEMCTANGVKLPQEDE